VSCSIVEWVLDVSRRGFRRPSFDRIRIFNISTSELKSLVCNRLNLLKFNGNDYQALNVFRPMRSVCNCFVDFFFEYIHIAYVDLSFTWSEILCR